MAGPMQANTRSAPLVPSADNRVIQSRTLAGSSRVISDQSPTVALGGRGRQIRCTLPAREAFSLAFSRVTSSVTIGQDAVISQPLAIIPVKSASQPSVVL